MPYIGQRPSKGDENNFKILDDISSYTLTFDGSDSSVVSAANDTITSLTHRFVQGQRVTYNKGSGGTVIAGLSDGVYFIIKEDHNTIKLATSASNATNGIAVNITGVGGGSSHTLNVAFDGVNTKFKATHTNGQKARITRSAQLVISINGVIQQPHDTATPSTGFGFDLDGTIVFSQAPVATDDYWAHVLTNNNVTFDISDNDIDNFTGDGSTREFNLSKSPPDNRNVLVTIDGVIQYPDDPNGTVRSYTVVENVLTFVTAPASGVEIQVRHIGFAGSTSGSGGVTNFYGRTGSVVLKDTDNISVNDAAVTGDLTVTGDMTINGDFTTLNTTLREVELLHVDASNDTATAGIITQRGTGDILNLFDNNSEVLTVTDGGQVGINSTSPSIGAILDIGVPTTKTGGLDATVSIASTDNKTYPNVASFSVTLGLKQEIEVGGTQTLNPSSPGGYNFITGITNFMRKKNGNVQDVERSYYAGLNQNFFWNDQNTLKQYKGITDSLSYFGNDANGRTTSYLIADEIYVQPGAGKTVTINQAYGKEFRFQNFSGDGGTPTTNVTNWSGFRPTLNWFLINANYAGTMTDAHFYDTGSSWGVTVAGSGSVNYTITNLYGLRLRPPGNSTGLTITNNYGISQEWEAAKNYLAGDVGIGELTPDSKLDILHSSSTNSATENLIHLRTDPGVGYVSRGLFIKIGRDENYDNSAAHYDIVGSSGNSGLHIFEVQGDEKLRITKEGFVGIGTSIGLTDILTVNDTNPKISMRDGGTERAFLHVDSSDDFIVNNKSISNLIFKTQDVEKLRITSDGFVGIGTITPNTGLSIGKFGDYSNGDGNTYWQPEGKWISVWNNANDIQADTDYWVGFNGGYHTSGQSVNICLAPNRGNLNAQQGMYIAGEATAGSDTDITFGKIVGGDTLGRDTTASSGKRATKVELVRITKNGVVGINTTVTAATQLQVQSDGTSTTAGGNIVARFQSFGSGRDATIQLSDNVAHSATISMLSSALVFKQSGTETFRITSGGKIGIGLTSTSAGGICDPDSNQLLIRGPSTFQTNKGHIMLTGDSATNGQGPQIVFSESGSGSNFAGAYIGHVRSGSNSIGDLVFGTRQITGDTSTVPTERLRIKSDGKVGIGTALVSPTHRLHVYGTGNNGGVRLENSHSTTTVSGNTAVGAFPHNLVLSNYSGQSTADNRMVSIGFDIPTTGNHANATIAYQAAGSTGVGNLQFWLENGNTSYQRLRITSGGDIITQGLTSRSFNNDGNNAKVLEVTGDGTVGEYGVLNLSGNQNSSTTVGAIKFINRENSNSSSGSNANSRALATIDVYADTSDSNAGDDCGGFMRFVTKADGGGNAERLRITSAGLIRMGNGAAGNTEAHVTAAIFQNTTGAATILKLGNTNTPSSANNRAIEFCDGAGGTEGSSKYTYARIKAERTGGSNAGRLMFFTKPDNSSDATEKLRIESDGEVKINGDGSGTGYLRVVKDRDTAYNANGGNGQDLIVQQISDSTNTQGYSALALQCNYTGQTGAWVALNAVRTGVGEADLTINPRNNTTGDVERVRITSSGKVSLGNSPTSSPLATLHVRNSGNNSATLGGAPASIMIEAATTDNWQAGEAGAELLFKKDGGIQCAIRAEHDRYPGDHSFEDCGLAFYTSPASEDSSGTRKMLLSSLGTLIVSDDPWNKLTSAYAVHNDDGRGVNITENGRVYCKTDDHWDLNHVGAGLLIRFRAGNDAGTTQTVVGNITLGTGSVAFNETQSDIRLKKNIEPWTDGVLQHFKTLQPKKFHFNWESDSDPIRTGYIAQDLVGAFPEAYPLCKTDIGESEEVDRHFFNPSGMVKYLMKALQEEIVKREEIEAKYNALEARISALEGS